MVNWQDPTIVLKQLESLVKLIHVVDGIYIWEFISSLDYEWSIIRGRRQWRWTIWLYVGCRLLTFAEVLSDLTGFNVTHPINCEVWLIFLLVFAYGASSLALSLYSLRSVAIWQKNRFVVALVAFVWATNVGFWIRSVAQARAGWSPSTNSCALYNTDKALDSNLTALVTDGLILVLIASGLFHKSAGQGQLLRLLQREGLLWLLLATVVQLLPVIFLAMNLNEPMNMMFQTPSLICSTIGATRIYRHLSSVGSGNVLEYWESTRNEQTGEIRFRRQTHYMSHEREIDDPDVTSNSTAVMGIKRFVERFEAREIRLEDGDVEVDEGSVVGSVGPEAKRGL
ncbi:hypothetical protein BV25DRAFT_1899351 [Artomyces pyxidatus]|uniref:Uncharacterized protein n=1 Tax=Artomyces pyxidatus TaxID=48021 RepID=A0ACB8T5G8_9AGAM|nr:hypothetical protein BV25DRAFT_1899351 [Artomyces pyxidatus]